MNTHFVHSFDLKRDREADADLGSNPIPSGEEARLDLLPSRHAQDRATCRIEMFCALSPGLKMLRMFTLKEVAPSSVGFTPKQAQVSWQPEAAEDLNTFRKTWVCFVQKRLSKLPSLFPFPFL